MADVLMIKGGSYRRGNQIGNHSYSFNHSALKLLDTFYKNVIKTWT